MLMNLVAKQNGANVNLTWSTSSEFNNSHFVVERSIDGVNYNAIGEVLAVGNSTTSTSYNYLDLNVQQLGEQFVYYRVRQVSLDNSFSYTRRALVDYNYTPEEFNVSTVLPNPFVTEVTVGFTVNTTSPVNIRLMDINGKLDQRRISNPPKRLPHLYLR
jgi:hypothetical protein